MKYCFRIILPVWKPSVAFNSSRLNCSFSTYSFPKSFFNRRAALESCAKDINLRTRYIVTPMTASINTAQLVCELFMARTLCCLESTPMSSAFSSNTKELYASIPGDVQMGVCLNFGIPNSIGFRQVKDSLKRSKI